MTAEQRGVDQEGSTARTTDVGQATIAPACPTCGGRGTFDAPFDGCCPAEWAHQYVRPFFTQTRSAASHAELSRLREALRPFAAMHRDGSDPKEHACVRGIASDMTVITSGDFQRAAECLRERGV